MNSADLDYLDAVVAQIEGRARGSASPEGTVASPGQSAYQPTRDPGEAMRLMDKYIARVVRTGADWAAVGPGGRACTGPTLPIAVCKAIVESRSPPRAD